MPLVKIFNALSISVNNFGTGIPCGPPPLFCGHALMPQLLSSSGAVVVLKLPVWWNKGTKPPSSWQQGSLFNWLDVLCIRVEDINLLQILTWRGTYPLHTPFWSCIPWPSSMSTCVGHGVYHLLASMGIYIIPLAKCTCSFRCLHPLHITWSLWP